MGFTASQVAAFEEDSFWASIRTRELTTITAKNGFAPDWTGRYIVEGKKGSIPRDLAPLMDRMELNTENRLDTVQHFGGTFLSHCRTGKDPRFRCSRHGSEVDEGKNGGRAAFT